MKKLIYTLLFLLPLLTFSQTQNGGTSYICKGQSITFLFSSSSSQTIPKPVKYTWINPGGIPSRVEDTLKMTALYPDTGIFINSLIIDYEDNTQKIVEFKVYVHRVNFEGINFSDTILCTGSSIILDAKNISPNVHYLWTSKNAEIPGTFYLNRELKVTQPGEYYVRIFNSCGYLNDTILVKPSLDTCGVVVYFPNAFSPNGDYVNDTFNINFKGYSPYLTRMSIYNRWGELLFESTDLKNGWDGRYKGSICESGTYLCIVVFKSLPPKAQSFYLIR